MPALSVACGLQVVREIMAADITRICGPEGKHDPDLGAYRHGAEARLVPLGGALLEVERPWARTKEGREVPLPSYECFASRDLLHEVALGRMLAGLSTRRYLAGAPSRSARSSAAAPRALRSRGAFAARRPPGSPSCSVATLEAWICSRFTSTA